MCKLSPVAFHGDTIFCVDYHGEPYVPMRQMVENLGMNWGAQADKLKANRERWGVRIIRTPSAGGVQEMVCLPLRKLAAWLASINPKKVRQELRVKIELYQAESDDALWNYWMKGRAERKIQSRAIEPAKDKFIAYIEEVEDFRSRTAKEVETLFHKGLDMVDVQKLGPGAIIGFTPVILDWLRCIAGSPTPIFNPNEPMERAISYSPLYLIRHLEKRLPDLKK